VKFILRATAGDETKTTASRINDDLGTAAFPTLRARCDICIVPATDYTSPKSNNFIVKNKDLAKRICFTLGVLILIRLATYLTVPGITVSPNLGDLSSEGQFFGLISMLGGGTLGKFSILALGVSPYITASIIVQLLSTDVVPPLAR
jgi:hypothetical protein